MAVLYAFDVDNTLQIGPKPGPVTMEMVMHTKLQGNVVAVCGDWFILFKYYPDWHKIFSLVGPIPGRMVSKALWLKEIKDTLRRSHPIQFTDFVMVGNYLGEPGATPGAMDDAEARLAGWRFIWAKNFSLGRR